MRTLPVLGIILTWPLFAKADITYTKDIAPIIQENCAGCHRPGEAAPFALRDYEEVRRRARMIRRTVSDKIMPPWHAIGGDVPIVGDRQLSEEQITLIEKWVDAGLPEGDTADLPEPKEFPDGWKLGTPDLVLEMEESYQLYAEGPDVYRNFVLPTGLKEQRWLKAIEFHPGNPEIVHHTLFYLDTTGSARRTDAADPEPGFAEMPFGEGVGKSLGGWAPGMMPVPLPDGLAFSLPAGGDIILSTHFHPSGKAESERSTIGLYFSDEPPKREFLVIQLPPIFGAFAGVDIPPGERDKTITDTFELPVDVEAFGAVGHQARLTARTGHHDDPVRGQRPRGMQQLQRLQQRRKRAQLCDPQPFQQRIRPGMAAGQRRGMGQCGDPGQGRAPGTHRSHQENRDHDG